MTKSYLLRIFFSGAFFFVRTVRSDDLDPWSESFLAPPEILTERIRPEPLNTDQTELDYEAVMGSRDHLRKVLVGRVAAGRHDSGGR